VGDVRFPHCVYRVWRKHRRFRNIGETAPIRTPESQRAIGLSRDFVALFVDGAVMAATEQG
jgi:hypothetical protein